MVPCWKERLPRRKSIDRFRHRHLCHRATLSIWFNCDGEREGTPSSFYHSFAAPKLWYISGCRFNNVCFINVCASVASCYSVGFPSLHLCNIISLQQFTSNISLFGSNFAFCYNDFRPAETLFRRLGFMRYWYDSYLFVSFFFLSFFLLLFGNHLLEESSVWHRAKSISSIWIPQCLLFWEYTFSSLALEISPGESVRNFFHYYLFFC